MRYWDTEIEGKEWLDDDDMGFDNDFGQGFGSN